MSINWQMERQNVTYPYNGIPFSNKNEVATDTCYDMDEPQKYAQEKNPETRDHILYGQFI